MVLSCKLPFRQDTVLVGAAASLYGSFQHPESDKISIRLTGGQSGQGVTGPGAAWCL